ncbi:MAG: hypothetical protein LKG27_08140 [Clostridiaceae bacterium]|jgi:hypothetical protein|nr:hypothetical protein [Clostridiaceae bacterium]
MLVSPIQNNYSSPNFTGITKLMKRSVFIDGKKDISAILQKRGDKNTYINELPPVIFYALPKENRPNAIKEFIHVFDDIANEIRNFKPSINANTDEYSKKRPNSAVSKLKNIFQKYGLIENPEKFDLLYIGEGEYKKAFKIEGVKDKKTKEELCFKIFHVVDKTPEWHKYKSHGNYAEINISSYWRNVVGQETQRGKVYFGDINNGYMLDRYVDENIVPPKKIIDEYNYGIKITDEFKGDSGHNKMYGYSIDPGGSRVVNRVKNSSKTARYVLKRIKALPANQREVEWYKILNDNKLDETQKQAGLALAVRDLGSNRNDQYIKRCLDFNKPFVDQALAYALKYLPPEQSRKYFEVLMKRKNPVTQTVLLNEIPLLSRVRLNTGRIDDLDVPRGEIEPEAIEDSYKLAQKYVLPEVEEHLASYIHLLPQDRILPEADSLISKHNYNINDRLLHKIKFVSETEFPFANKMAILNKIEQNSTDEFILQKTRQIRTKIIRDSLGDD